MLIDKIKENKDQVFIILRSTLLFAFIFQLVSYLKEGIFSIKSITIALVIGLILSVFFRVLFSALAKKEMSKQDIEHKQKSENTNKSGFKGPKK